MIEVLRFEKPLLADPSSDKLNEKINEEFLTRASEIEQKEPGKYDMTPDLAKELHLSTNTLRVRTDGTGIVIVTPQLATASINIQHRRGLKHTSGFDRQILRLPTDANRVLIGTDYYERFQEGENVVVVLDGRKPCREQPKLIFSAVRHVA